MKYAETPIVNNEATNQFEFIVDGKRSFIDYKKEGDKIFLTHTEVSKALEGKGVAGAMVQKAFQYLEEHALKLVPKCSYIRTFLNRHPEWNRLLEQKID